MSHSGKKALIMGIISIISLSLLFLVCKYEAKYYGGTPIEQGQTRKLK